MSVVSSGRSPSSLQRSIQFHQDNKLIYQALPRNHFTSGAIGQGDSLRKLFMRACLEANCKQFMASGYFKNQIAVLGVMGKTGTKDQTF